MTEAFQQINSFISTTIADEKSGNVEINFSKLNEHIEKEFDKLFFSLEKRIYEQSNQEQLTIFIQFAQVRLTTLTDCLMETSKSFDVGSVNFTEMNISLNVIHIKVLQALDYLHSHFAANFDTSKKLPNYFLTIREKCILTTKNISAGLLDRNINNHLSIILHDFVNCLQVPCEFNVTTWQQYDYLLIITKKLIQFLDLPMTGEDATFKVIQTLIRNNFNSNLFYEFMLKFIDSKIDDEFIYEEQETMLILLLKTFEDIGVEENHSFNPGAPSLKELLSASIRRNLVTISLLKEVYRQSIIKNEGRNSDFHFEIDCTLEELFFLLKILFDLNFVRTKFKSLLYTFVSRFVKTNLTATPSSKYMRNIFNRHNEIPRKIIVKTRAKLMALVNYIDDRFQENQ